SRTTATTSSICLFFAFATAAKFSCVEALISISPTASGPTAIFFIYISGACSRLLLSAIAITAKAFQVPCATMFVPSKGSTATSTCGPMPVPSFSPIYNIGDSYISPSPMTTVPCIGIVSTTSRKAEVAASSASSCFPLPIQRSDDNAAASVTRTISIVKLLSIIPSPLEKIPQITPLQRRGMYKGPQNKDVRQGSHGQNNSLSVSLISFGIDLFLVVSFLHAKLSHRDR